MTNIEEIMQKDLEFVIKEITDRIEYAEEFAEDQGIAMKYKNLLVRLFTEINTKTVDFHNQFIQMKDKESQI